MTQNGKRSSISKDRNRYGSMSSHTGDLIIESTELITDRSVVFFEEDDEYEESQLFSKYRDKEAAKDQSEDNIFSNIDVAKHYREVYELSEYEGRHVFDPSLTWSKEEERDLVWKLEKKVALWSCIMFMALQMDRGNIGQALSDNMLKDLEMTTNHYNMGQTIFYISFLAAELPSQLISKKLGPDRWIPIQITLWSLVAVSQAQLTGPAGFYWTRALLGMLEGGFIADIVLWLSYFYTSKELPMRLSWFWTSCSLTRVLTSIMAFGLLHMRGIWGWEGWRWLFFIEGLLTLTVGVASFFLMPASPVQTKTWFRPKGWFTDREERIVVNRVLRDDPSKGDMNNRAAITFKMLWDIIKDYDMWPLYLIGLIAFVPTGTASAYLTLTLRNLGFSQFNTNLLTIPVDLIHTLLLLTVTYTSELFTERSFICLLQPLWIIPCISMLRWWPGTLENIWGTYAILVVLLSAPYIHAILVSWCSRNSNAVGSRTLSSALYNMFVQGGSIISSNIYRNDDLPKYHRGNQTLLCFSIATFFLILATKGYYIWRNNQKEKIWNLMNTEEKRDYRKWSKDVGNKRLDFRFVH